MKLFHTYYAKLQSLFNAIYIQDKSKNIFLRFIALYFLLNDEYKEISLGSLWSKSSLRSSSFKFLTDFFNTNNLGSSYDSSGYLLLTKKVEKKVVEWVKQKVGAHGSVIGYVTSGGTEANIILMWQAREFFRSQNLQDPIVLHTGFTHYSITKAARLIDVQVENIFHDLKKFWIMDSKFLKSYLIKKIKLGQLSFIIPMTVGYSSTGLSDPIEEILQLVEELSSEYTDFNCYLWIDAAAQGLPHMFLSKNFKPMNSSLIKGYVLDFHKFGSVSLPAGVVLYSKESSKFIESPINYLEDNDVTLLGSRPGSSAIAIWEEIFSKSEREWKNKFLLLRKKKEYVISLIKKNFPKAEIISDTNSLTFAVVCNDSFPKLDPIESQKYGIVLCNVNGIKHYKFHINP